MTKKDISKDLWHWYHNILECYYHIQLTIKYRKSLFIDKTEKTMKDTISGFKERYAIEISHIGLDRNHVHLLVKFLPKYSAGQVIRLIKSKCAKEVFKKVPELKKELWGGEFWTDGYYISTISGKGDKKVIENYIINQGNEADSRQLKLFEL
jgi:putative transposase